ncbi:uncharacterized protein LOC118203533 [Stegodyphus dumicola]|uniref:uncharacterized protein LOC118203533 n=1 Tax=Stegodyphus dumicola TaxID=202533 RepID=UPI0015AF70E1|nr:uncharacterized protein LOC118203533 [Stegodyphus dumicola]
MNCLLLLKNWHLAIGHIWPYSSCHFSIGTRHSWQRRENPFNCKVYIINSINHPYKHNLRLNTPYSQYFHLKIRPVISSMMNVVLVMTLAALSCLLVVSEPPPKKLFFRRKLGVECDSYPCAIALYERFTVPSDTSTEETMQIKRITQITAACDCKNGTACTLKEHQRKSQDNVNVYYYSCQPLERYCNLKG